MSDLLGLGSLIDAGTNIINSAYNIFNSERNDYRYRQQRSYNDMVWRTQMKREDNAVQRRAADLQKAGFNPLLAAAQGASSGATVTQTHQNNPSPDIRTHFADIALAMARMKMDYSMTNAQKQLIGEQADVARQNAELLRLQKEWYENHPEFAPGVESGFHTGKGLASAFTGASERISSWFAGNPQRANPQFDKIVKYHMNNGVPAKEAVRRANKMLANYK